MSEVSSGFGTPAALKKLDLFHIMEVLLPEYFQSISRIFPYYGLDKTMEIGFSNIVR